MENRRRHARGAGWALGAASVVIQLPLIDRGISFYDEGSMLAIADALAHGEALYRDRVTQLGPLAYELLALCFRIFGESLWVGRTLQALVFSGCVVLVYALLRRLVGTGWAIAGGCAVLAVKTLAFPYWTAINYAPVALLWCLGSAAALARSLSPDRARADHGWLMVAGLGVGLAFVTKQNLGGLLGLAFAAVVLVDWATEPRRARGALFARAATLSLGTLVPIGIVGACYAWSGTLGDLLRWSIVGLLHMAAPYQIPFPGLELWAAAPERIGEVAFAYFPPPLLLASWHCGLDLARGGIALPVELFVKACYFAPLVLAGWGGVQLLRLRTQEPRSRWSRRLVVLALAVACTASVLARGRTDWIHLMSIYPGVVPLAVCVLSTWAREIGWRRGVAWGLWVVWMGAGLGVGVAVFSVYRTPVDTPRGRLLGAPDAARNANRVLRYLSAQPPHETLLVLRGEPLYYYLSGRRIPIRFDLFMPGVIGPPENDARVAERLADVDQVLYNPKPFPTVPLALPDYAPRTAQMLASHFRIDRVVSETAFVLRRVPEEPERDVVLDLWEATGRRSLPGAGRAGPYERVSWMMYRVFASSLSDGEEPACLDFAHLPRLGEELEAIPIVLPPDFWVARSGRASASADFEVSVVPARGPAERVYAGRVSLEAPAPAVRVPLDAYAGREATLELCVSSGAGPRAKRAGWAAVRVTRPRGENSG